MQIFLVISTCVLYLVAAGLFSRAFGYFDQQKWDNIIGGDATELGVGAGTYDVDKVVWHVNVSSNTIARQKLSCPSHSIDISSLPTVLRPGVQWRWRLGYLQCHPGLEQHRHLQLCHLLQRVLDLRHHRVPVDAIPGDQGPLALHEAQANHYLSLFVVTTRNRG